MEKKYLNEEEYIRNNKKVNRVGKVVLITGIILIIFAVLLMVISFLGLKNTVNVYNFNSTDDSFNLVTNSMFGSFGLFAIAVFLSFIGFTCLMFGAVLTLTSHRREITAYTTQQAMPIVKETMDEVTPSAAKAAGTVAKEVTKGVKEALNEENE